MSFHDVNLKNNGAIVIPSLLLCEVMFAIVLVSYVKHLQELEAYCPNVYTVPAISNSALGKHPPQPIKRVSTWYGHSCIRPSMSGMGRWYTTDTGGLGGGGGHHVLWIFLEF